MAILNKENDSGNTGGVTEVSHRNSIDREVANAVARIHNLGYDCLELSISFYDLVNKDWTPLSVVTGDTSDPICVVSTKNEKTGQWEEQGRTEIIANKTTGQFVKNVYVKYRFEQACQIKFSLYDCDDSFKSNDSTMIDISRQDFLGFAECDISEIVGMGNHTMNLQGVNKGKITVNVMPKPITNDILLFHPRFTNLNFRNFCLFGCCMSGASVYMVISIRSGQDYINVYRTTYVVTTGNGSFPNVEIEVSKLGNLDVPFRIQVFRYDNPNSVLIGQVDTTLDNLLRSERLDLYNQEVQRRNRKGNVGQLIFDEKKINHHPTFMDYINHRLQIGFQIVVDFTGSNGDPKTPSSLHHLAPVDPSSPFYTSGFETMSEYMKAIKLLYNVVHGYDSDGMIPLWGYGALIPTSTGGKINSWDFPINGDDANPSVHGIHGVMEAYKHALTNIELSGPTHFAPIIRKVTRLKREELARGTVQFDIITILTDGEINDMRETIDAIVDASVLPMVFLIVGIGNGQFVNMKYLDADGTVLKASSGKRALRDNVQFVKFNDYRNNPFKFSEEALAEIPEQLVDSMKILGKKPTDFSSTPTLESSHVQISLPPSYRESCANLGGSEQ
jgi:hypothetical protein